MRLLIFGKNGQVASELADQLGFHSGIGAPLSKSLFEDVQICSSKEVDFTKIDSVVAAIRNFQPTHIINAAAYTAVDKAESEKELAMQINASAVGVIGEEAKKIGAFVLHYSTDYVFNGKKESAYVESDVTAPVNVYGYSKWKGENLLLASGCEAIVLRVSWVYGKFGNNFYKTMLRLGGERELLKIVGDQRGAPTWSYEIAKSSLEILKDKDLGSKCGVYHLSPAGDTTWFGFAEAIFKQARAQNIPLKIKTVEAIPSSEYPTPAMRPLNSRMNAEKIKKYFGLSLLPWEESLKRFMKS